MNFNQLQLIEPLLRALQHEGYTTPTPIQQQAIPAALSRKDILGCAQTGTGKTAAFALPLLQLMDQDKQHSNSNAKRTVRTLILTPTRELAIQIGEGFASYGKHLPLRHAVIYGGVSQSSQVRQLQSGVDTLIATPGRMLDLMQQGYISLNHLQYFVLDEADRMLDMGFVHDVKRIIAKLPAKRQTMFFSATMPREISTLAQSILTNPVRIEVAPVSSTVDTIQQHIFFTEKENKLNLLKHVLSDDTIRTALVFTRTKHGADKLSKFLNRSGIKSEAIHGNKSQGARQNALRNFKNRSTRILVATDIAARGIDIDDLTHVVNYELPEVPETYVHRIGRTGRAGASGQAFSFCAFEEKQLLREIQKLISKNITVVHDHPFAMSQQLSDMREPPRQAQAPKSAGSRGGGGKRGRGLFRPAPAR